MSVTQIVFSTINAVAAVALLRILYVEMRRIDRRLDLIYSQYPIKGEAREHKPGGERTPVVGSRKGFDHSTTLTVLPGGNDGPASGETLAEQLAKRQVSTHPAHLRSVDDD